MAIWNFNGTLQMNGKTVKTEQSDWNETNTESDAYIKNKPTIPSAVVIDSEMNEKSANPVQNKVVKDYVDTAYKFNSGDNNGEIKVTVNNKSQNIKVKNVISTIKFEGSEESYVPDKNGVVTLPESQSSTDGIKKIKFYEKEYSPDADGVVTLSNVQMQGLTIQKEGDEDVTYDGTKSVIIAIPKGGGGGTGGGGIERIQIDGNKPYERDEEFTSTIRISSERLRENLDLNKVVKTISIGSDTFEPDDENNVALEVKESLLTGGAIKGKLKIYANGKDTDPDFKVDNERIDIFKTDSTDSPGSSDVVLEKGKSIISKIPLFLKNSELILHNSKNGVKQYIKNQEGKLLLNNEQYNEEGEIISTTGIELADDSSSMYANDFVMLNVNEEGKIELHDDDFTVHLNGKPVIESDLSGIKLRATTNSDVNGIAYIALSNNSYGQTIYLTGQEIKINNKNDTEKISISTSSDDKNNDIYINQEKDGIVYYNNEKIFDYDEKTGTLYILGGRDEESD